MALLSCEYYSQARRSQQSFNVIMPMESMPDMTGKVAYSEGPFKTLYLLHGYSGSRNDWQRNSLVETWAKEHRYAVVMPDGANSFYLDNEETGELYGSFIGEELVQVSRQMFPLSQKREDTVLAGLSMGGFGALRNGLYYSDVFSAVIALSSALIADEVAAMRPGESNAIAPYSYYRHTFGPPEKLLGSIRDPKYLAKRCLDTGSQPRIFLACGREDFLYPENRDFHEHLKVIGYQHKWWVRSGTHDFIFWGKALQEALRWLAGEQSKV